MKKIELSSLQNNIFDEFNKGWALLCVGDEEKHNTMTISWGQAGHLWHKNIVTVYVRPTRYTNEFMKENDYFSVCFFKGNNRKELAYLGKVSGKDEDKITKSGLNKVMINNVLAFDEASYIFICKKIYVDSIKPEKFIDESIDKEYYLKDYHDVYIGEIIEVYEK